MKYTDAEWSILNCKDSSYEILFSKASLLIRKWFGEKKDKGGFPYINHLLYVSSGALTDDEQIAALLHDIIEDTEVTFENLEDFGFPPSIIDILKLLTRDKSVSYEDYIANIINSGNVEALRIKKRDMEHNVDPSRLDDVELIKKLKNKYEPNYKKIKEALERKE